jgi:hypothetical protein
MKHTSRKNSFLSTTCFFCVENIYDFKRLVTLSLQLTRCVNGSCVFMDWADDKDVPPEI